MDWHSFNYVEGIAVIFSLLSVLYTIKENILLWPTGILGVIFYMVVFWQQRLYAETGLQIFFIFLQIYGWYEWLHGGKDKSELKISRSSFRLNLLLTMITIMGTLGMAYLLYKLMKDASLPLLDSLITVLSLVAQWMLARKLLENWLAWIVVDIISVGVYWYKGLIASALLYLLFLVLAIVGFFEWQKTYR